MGVQVVGLLAGNRAWFCLFFGSKKKTQKNNMQEPRGAEACMKLLSTLAFFYFGFSPTAQVSVLRVRGPVVSS